MTTDSFYRTGWFQFDQEPAILRWIESALPAARLAVSSESNRSWFRYADTWFVGVNALPNDNTGAIDGSGPVTGNAVDFVQDMAGAKKCGIQWDRAQISVCYPGYPQQDAQESEKRFHFRKNYCAAHVDGLHRVGTERRRYLRETHAFILGIPMVEFSADASPFVVWEGSHEIVRKAFTQRLKGIPPDEWQFEDLTETYTETRDRVFEKCPRISLFASPGQVFLVHRLCVHGTESWGVNAQAGEDGRMICYFRPDLTKVGDWLYRP